MSAKLFLRSVFLMMACLPLTSSAQANAAQQRLKSLRAVYESAHAKEVAAAHDTSVRDLDAKYTSALDRALATATQAGELDTALALRDEIKRVKETRPLPADDFAAPETLKTLRLTYRSALANLEVKRDQLAAPVKARYDAALEALQTELTKAGDLDGAVAVKSMREGLKTEAAPMPVKEPEVVRHEARPMQPPAAPSAAPTRNVGAAAAGDDADAMHKLAEWAFSRKGSVFIITKGQDQPVEIKNAADLPASGWSLHTVAAGGYDLNAPDAFPWELIPKVPGLAALAVNQKQPLSVEHASLLSSVPALVKLDIANMTVPLPALQAMPVFKVMGHLKMGSVEGDVATAMRLIGEKFPGLPILEINFEVPVDLLPGSKDPLFKLKEIALKGPLTPAMVDKLAKMPDLKSFESKDCRDKTLPQDLLLPLKKFRYIKLRRCVALPDLLPQLEQFDQLDLVLIGLSSMDTLAPETLRLLTDLKSRRLDLDGGLSKNIGDEHVDALTEMKGVKELRVVGHRISREGIARLRKALPGCKITI